MKITLKAVLTIILLNFGSLSAQNITIKGVLVDKINKEKISNAVIYLLRAKDSILLDFTRSKTNSTFELTTRFSDSVILLVSHSNYAEYIDIFKLNNVNTFNFDSIYLTNKAKLLETIIIKGTKAAIIMKGDTTEYNAESFYVPPNATVEDLLKKLPGIRVDKSGKITAQGERVTQILVDGEEFFSNDPTLTMQNLNANMIAKVQVYDKKNDFGNSSKIINLKLKEDKKIGYFGKAISSYGTNKYYNNKIIYNSFKGKRKIASYGILSNTGLSGGLNSDEEETFEVSSLANSDDNLGALDIWNGNYNQKGLPLLKVMGIQYYNKFFDDKQLLNGNYKAQNLKIDIFDTTTSKINLPDTSFYINEKVKSSHRITRNRITTRYEIQIDSTTNLKLRLFGETQMKESNYNSNTESIDNYNNKINTENKIQTINGRNSVLNSSLVLTKRWNKPKTHTATLTITENYKTDNAKGYLFSENLFYKLGNINQSFTTDQLKTNNYTKLNIDTKLSYSVPVSKYEYLFFILGLTSVNSKTVVNSFNKSILGGNYDLLDSLYSNNLDFKTNLLKGEIAYRVQKSKYYFATYLGIGKTNFKQIDKYNSQTLQSAFINFFPKIVSFYQIARREKVFFNYDGTTINPSIQQIQNLKSNIDPLNIISGNSDLTPSFYNSAKLSYWAAKTKTERDFWVRLNYTFVNNEISSNSRIDSFGRKFYQFININGNRTLSENIEYSRKIQKLDLYISTKANFSQSRFVNIINDKQNILNSLSKGFMFGVEKRIDKQYEASIEFALKHISNKSSISSERIKYSEYQITPNINLYFAHKFQFHSDCSIIFRKTNSNFINPANNIVWNTWIEKTVFKNNDLQIRIAVNDILNRNIGYVFDANTNFIKQNGFNVIKRYGALSLIWNFNKGKADD